jgi:hypothetical protein
MVDYTRGRVKRPGHLTHACDCINALGGQRTYVCNEDPLLIRLLSSIRKIVPLLSQYERKMIENESKYCTATATATAMPEESSSPICGSKPGSS